jgi:thiosulfate dehydrogenase
MNVSPRLLLRTTATAVVLTLSVLVVGCRMEQRLPANDTTVVDATTLPEPTPHQRVAFRIPSESEIDDPTLLASVRRGRAILRATRDSLPRHVRNKLACVSCHQQDGTVKNGMPWVGVYARFPQYRSRSGGTQIIEDRINDCFKRSMNGSPLVPESRDMRDIVAYMAFLSMGYPVGAEVDGQGVPALTPVTANLPHGRVVYRTRCARCHGVRGEGIGTAGALWGNSSYNIGAGMARLNTAAAFIKARMPQDSAGVLSDQDAFDVARFINSQPRPDFVGKERDWPRGDPPPDVAYPTRALRGKGK